MLDLRHSINALLCNSKLQRGREIPCALSIVSWHGLHFFDSPEHAGLADKVSRLSQTLTRADSRQGGAVIPAAGISRLLAAVLVASLLHLAPEVSELGSNVQRRDRQEYYQTNDEIAQVVLRSGE